MRGKTLRLVFAMTVIAAIAMTCIDSPVYGRKKVLKISTELLDTVPRSDGSIVLSATDSLSTGRSLEQLRFYGYDKPTESAKEAFFITNSTDGLLKSVDIQIEYLTVKGQQLHKRSCHIDCDIPAGETRQVDIKSWDTQKSFYYYGGRKPLRRSSTPYMVRFKALRAVILPQP